MIGQGTSLRRLVASVNPDDKCPLVVGEAFERDRTTHGMHEFAA